MEVPLVWARPPVPGGWTRNGGAHAKASEGLRGRVAIRRSSIRVDLSAEGTKKYELVRMSRVMDMASLGYGVHNYRLPVFVLLAICRLIARSCLALAAAYHYISYCNSSD